VFVSGDSGSVGWWIVMAACLVVAVFSGGFDLTPLWSFLSTAGAGYFLQGSAGLYTRLPWFSKMVSGKGVANINLFETIRVINTKVIPLAAVFHLAMLSAIVGLAVEVVREAKNKAIVIVGITWPVVFWAFRALELTQVEWLKGFSLPLPAFLLAGVIHALVSGLVGGQVEGETGRALYGIPARLDFILLGCVLCIWSYVAFVP